MFKIRLAPRRSVGAMLAVLILSAMLGSCSSGMQVRSDSNPQANFAAYRSFGFFQPMGIEAGYNSPVFGEHFRTAISQEMESRGYQLSSQPDLIVNVTARIDEKVKMTSYTAPYISGMYYDTVTGPYYGSGLGVGVELGQRPTRTEEISVFIDLVDNSAERLVWQGVAVFDGSDEKAQELQKTINETVSRIFAQYTQSAGQ